LENSWLRHRPTERQARFLYLTCREALFGGAAGGGKSDALLMAALQFAGVPQYRAILFRRTFTDLALSGALMDRAADWLGGTAAKWNDRDKTWAFPAGATLTFGYLDGPNDRYRYQSSEFQFIGFDELTQFREADYRFLFSRLRRLLGSRVPLRVRAASNPGGVGHDWVKQRFLVEGPTQGRVFVPARLDDNPHLDREQYVASLSELDPITRAQLLAGDWSVRQGGGIFRREWFRLADVPPPGLRLVRSWDLAATEPKPGRDPDWTAGVLVGRAEDGTFWVLDVRRVRATPQGVERLVLQTAQQDGPGVTVRMEQEPGSAGVALVQRYYSLLAGYHFRAVRATGDKVTRAAPLSSQAEAGRVVLVRGPWVGPLLDEAEAFPHAAHDDQIDALANGLDHLAGGAYPAVTGSLLCWPPLPGEYDDTGTPGGAPAAGPAVPAAFAGHPLPPGAAPARPDPLGLSAPRQREDDLTRLVREALAESDDDDSRRFW
jgi:predicted phage terminase large subunit-like protein